MQTNNTPTVQVPQAIEIERVVLGALLLEPEAITSVLQILHEDMFYDPRHRIIYREVLAMYDANQPIDFYSVSQRIGNTKDSCVNMHYLVDMTTLIGSANHVTTHAMIVKEKYLLREISNVGTRIRSLVEDPKNDISDIIAQGTRMIEQISEMTIGNRSAHHIGRIALKALQEAEKRTARVKSGEHIGIPTGLPDFDKLTGGWQPSTLNVIAGRPAMGKTAIMLHFALTAAEAGFPGCVYSLEMSNISLANRMLLAVSDVDVDRFRFGALEQTDWKELSDAHTRLEKLPIYIDDNPCVSMNYIRSHARLMQKKNGCQWVMIDYLQLTDMSTGNRQQNREQEVAKTTRQAKIISKELNIPVLLLSQLSRSVEGRSEKRPQLSDLRESGAIEQDADTVTFIYRPAYYRQDFVETKSHGTIPTQNLGFLYLDKQRDGALGSVSFLHNKSMTKIGSYSKTRQSELIHEGDYSLKSPF